MKLEQKVKSYLQNDARFRERRNKVRGIANLLLQGHPSIQGVKVGVMMEIVDEVIAMERYWRKILLDNPELRGTDYSTKKKVVDKHLEKLGYGQTP